ncbi:MAG TPA: hypothetical protein VMY37_06265 [Thermoguttaceae bacterium]|nr:hypothetical protein [Thermoguttaceae bacterium]
MARLIRIGGSLAIVLVTYWAYALVAVPLIEPSADRHRSEIPSEEEMRSLADQSRASWRRELEGLFPPGSWELDDPTIVEIDEAKLLLRDYSRPKDGKTVQIDKCTVIFTPHRPGATPDERRRGSIILEAPEGAVLEFNGPFDLRKGKVGRLDSGRLKGPITIRSDGKSPGREDDLKVLTRDVDLTEERICTKEDVDFQLGRNHGRGRELWIKFFSDPDEEGTKRRGPNVDGIESVEIVHLEELDIHLGDRGFVPGVEKTVTGLRAPGDAKAATDLPIDVKCRGPFRFDPVGQVATFQDQVDVRRVHPSGPADQLTSEKLSVFFARPREALPSQTKQPSGTPNPEPESETDRSRQLDLQPRRIRASGFPVVVSAPSQGIEARGEQLEYDFQSNWVVLDGTQEVFLKQGPNEIHARKLQCQMAENGRLGQAMAEGPGWLRVVNDEKPDQQFFARWSKRLHLRPHEGQPVISLDGDARLEFGDLGQLAATEIHLYLLELPADESSDRVRIRPDRLVALGQVVITSPQVTGTVNQLGVWFEPMPRSAGTGGQAYENTTPRDRRLPADGGAGRSDDAEQHDRVPGERPLGAAGISGSTESPLFPAEGPSAASRPDHHFEVSGRLLHAQVLIPSDVSSWEPSPDATSELAELFLEGNVELTETRTAQPGELPVAVRGESIHVLNASRPDRKVTVRGNPPSFDGRGLTLCGLNRDSGILLDSGKNELRIDEPGWTELPLDRDLEGRPLPEPGRLRVRWQKRMVFDGRRVRFEGDVVASGRHQRGETELHTPMLDVQLLRPVRFAGMDRRPDRVEVQRIVCYGSVFMQNRSFAEQGQSSLDRFQMANLDIDLQSGESTANGPGWMTTVRRGSSDLLAARRDEGSDADPSATNDGDPDPLRYLSVRFQGPLEGNVPNRRMTFRDQVQAAYAPVDCWEPALDPDDLEALGPRGVLLGCHELTVTDMPQPTGEGRAMELVATGNVVVEGRTFTARAPRMTYDDAKQLLILEDDGWTHAELYHQKQVGAPWSEVKAGRILYWRSTGQVHLERGRSLKSN